MSVTNIDSWRLPGCDDRCWPRRHDPDAHETYGRLVERDAQLRREGIRTGPLAINLGNGTATVCGAEVRLTPREWALLAYLSERLGQWCPAEEVYAAIWGAEDAWKNRLHNISVIVHRLREKLGADGAGLIEVYAGKLRLLRREPIS